MTTTLTEIKNKSDVIILFSDNMLKLYPRLIETVVAPKNSFSVNPKNKKIIIIGDKKSNLNSCPIKDSRINFIDYNNKYIPLLLQSIADKKNKSRNILGSNQSCEKVNI